MNQKIKEFWIKLGYEITVRLPDSYNNVNEWRALYFLKKDNKVVDICAISDVMVGSPSNDFVLHYYYCREVYLEEQMLKVIKMTAFA